MSKKQNVKVAENTNTNENVEEIMEKATVNVEVKGTEQTEEKPKKVYRSFKEIILTRIDSRMRNLPTEEYTPIREKIMECLIALEVLEQKNRSANKSEKTIARRLSKFTKAQIEAYLANLKDEE